MEILYYTFGIVLLHSVFGTNVKQHFTFFNVERTWAESKAICEDRGKTLLKIQTIQETNYVINLIKQHTGTFNFEIWTGLYRYSIGSEQWTDGSNATWTNYATGYPTGTNGTFCFSLNPPDGKWIERNCAKQFMFVCEKDIGNCTFNKRIAPTGCNNAALVLPEKLNQYEITEADCITNCLNSVNTNNVECWAAAHMPGCACPDCWIFNSLSTDYCILNEGNYPGVSLFLKICFEGDMETITTDAMTTDMTMTTSQVKQTTAQLLKTTDVTSLITTFQEIVASTTDSMCSCECKKIMTTEEIQVSIENIIKSIKIDKKDTSVYKRSLTSAPDKRLSSRVIGFSGVVILTIALLIIVCIDIKNLYDSVRMCCGKLKRSVK